MNEFLLRMWAVILMLFIVFGSFGITVFIYLVWISPIDDEVVVAGWSYSIFLLGCFFSLLYSLAFFAMIIGLWCQKISFASRRKVLAFAGIVASPIIPMGTIAACIIWKLRSRVGLDIS